MYRHEYHTHTSVLCIVTVCKNRVDYVCIKMLTIGLFAKESNHFLTHLVWSIVENAETDSKRCRQSRPCYGNFKIACSFSNTFLHQGHVVGVNLVSKRVHVRCTIFNHQRDGSIRGCCRHCDNEEGEYKPLT